MKLIYKGKKRPWTFSMPWLTRSYTFNDQPVEVDNRDGAYFLNECGNDFEQFGDIESIFHGSEDDEPIMVGDDVEDDGMGEEAGPEEAVFTCETCGKTYKSESFYQKHIEKCGYDA